MARDEGLTVVAGLFLALSAIALLAFGTYRLRPSWVMALLLFVIPNVVLVTLA